ncbi:MAG TPA: hypothetical protein VFC19_15740 [Candidatus Limnocylindrales bacterium]|nr:hypothetical protein [Candidatus Limnocylindrales bacterium]
MRSESHSKETSSADLLNSYLIRGLRRREENVIDGQSYVDQEFTHSKDLDAFYIFRRIFVMRHRSHPFGMARSTDPERRDRPTAAPMERLPNAFDRITKKLSNRFGPGHACGGTLRGSSPTPGIGCWNACGVPEVDARLDQGV